MLRKLTLKSSAISKLKSPISQFKKSEIEDSVKSFTPGEWVIVTDQQMNYLGYINPLVEDQFVSLRVVSKEINLEPLAFLKMKIENAISYRNQWKGYEAGSRRLFYGEQDGLPGLIIDQFLNMNIIQINSAGIDKYRNEIKQFLTEKSNLPSFLLDNENSRKKESLAFFNDEITFPLIEIMENQFHYKVSTKEMQKLGYYYDHRENRQLMENILNRWKNKIDEGLDLFCYLGAWSKHALRAGVDKMILVDQGNLQAQIQESFALDKMQTLVEFERSDVFKYLDKINSEDKKFSLIISDPPAFAKSPKQKIPALDGYKKLHQKIMKATTKQAIVVFASCTHYVDSTEFLTTIREAAKKEKKKLRLLSQGNQGFDHPTSGEGDSSNYIKSFIFYMENL